MTQVKKIQMAHQGHSGKTKFEAPCRGTAQPRPMSRPPTPSIVYNARCEDVAWSVTVPDRRFDQAAAVTGSSCDRQQL
jgi:hypothetical protein